MSSICIAYQNKLYAQGIGDYLKKRDPFCTITATRYGTTVEANNVAADRFDYIYVVNHNAQDASKTFGPEGKFPEFDALIASSSDQENAQKICVVYPNYPSNRNFNSIYEKDLANHKVHAIAIDFKNLYHKDHAALLKKYFTFGRNEGEAMWKTVLRIVSWITLLIPLIVGGLILYFHCTPIDAEVTYNHDDNWIYWPKKEEKSGCCCSPL
ncbi:MAG: hypothetical protein K940chlam9_01739 [Chlamydiae bacterium]|nr:hypothetical protein [Chlamydiota bacterium]